MARQLNDLRKPSSRSRLVGEALGACQRGPRRRSGQPSRRSPPPGRHVAQPCRRSAVRRSPEDAEPAVRSIRGRRTAVDDPQRPVAPSEVQRPLSEWNCRSRRPLTVSTLANQTFGCLFGSNRMASVTGNSAENRRTRDSKIVHSHAVSMGRQHVDHAVSRLSELTDHAINGPIPASFAQFPARLCRLACPTKFGPDPSAPATSGHQGECRKPRRTPARAALLRKRDTDRPRVDWSP